MEDAPIVPGDKPPAEVRMPKKGAMGPDYQVADPTHPSSTNDAPRILTQAPTRGLSNVRQTKNTTSSLRPA